jgi:hypothetical protein
VGVPAASLVQVIPDLIDTPLVSDTRGWSALPFPLTLTRGQDGLLTGRPVLEDSRPEQLLSHPEVRLLMATRGARPRLAGAVLRVVGTPCVYATEPGAKLADNQLLPFTRGGGCAAARVSAPSRLELEVVFTAATEIDLWTDVPPAGDASESMISVAVPAPAPGTGRPAVRGRLVRPGPGAGRARITLLNYVWQISEGPAWIWAGLAIAAALMSAGAFVYPWQAIGDSVPRAIVLRAGLGAACLAAALGVQYAILVPPLHAPDEPSHLLGYANVVNRAALSGEAMEWARRGHFQRIRFHSDEAFRVADLDNPLTIAWVGDVVPQPTEVRSPLTTAIWKAAAPLLGDAPVARVLLGIRMINGLLFTLAVGLAGCLIVWLGVGPYRQVAVLPFLIVPTVPFFAMHVSEFAVLTSVYVLLSACIAILVLDGPRTYLQGLPFGLAGVLALAAGRNAWPMGVLVLAVLMARVFLGTRGDQAGPLRLWRVVTFWVGIGLATSLIPSLLPTLRANVVLDLGVDLGRERFEPVLNGFAFLERWPLWSLGVPLGCAALELAFLGLRGRWRASWPRFVLTAVAVVAAAAMLALLAVSAFVDYPSLRALEGQPPVSSRQYVRDVLTVMATSFRFGSPDHLLVRSFWTGFGWIDTLPGPAVSQILMTASGLAAVALLAYLSASRDGRRLAMTLFAFGGTAAMLAAYALSVHRIDTNLHGRYLVGWYLCALSIAWSVVALLPPCPWRFLKGGPPRTAVLLTACGVLHAYCLLFILERYFR